MANPPDLYEKLSKQQKTAILMNVIGFSSAKSIFAHLSDMEVKLLIQEMNRIKKAPIALVKRILEDFFSALSEEETLIFAKVDGRRLVMDSLGAKRFEGIFGDASVKEELKTLEALAFIDSKTLGSFLLTEHPQTIAVVVAHLEGVRKNEVLLTLPDSLQSEVALRLAKLDTVSPDLVSRINDVLMEKLSAMGSLSSSKIGGVAAVAQMLVLMDKKSEERILQQIEAKDPALVKEIRDLMFVFGDLVQIDDRGLQTLLREIPSEKLTLALKVASSGLLQKIFKNMPTRAAQLMQEEIEGMSPKRLSEVIAAQTEIIYIAKQMESSGKISLARSNSESMV